MDAASDILHGRPPPGPTSSSTAQSNKDVFASLRRLHGQHNLDHRGLNDLTEQFHTFVTRARFFAVGRLRRTWSHSAVDFIKYRRRLPALLAPESDGEDDLPLHRLAIAPVEESPCKVEVSNVSIRATSTQLASLFTKFGPVQSCQMAPASTPSPYSTMPRRRHYHGIAHVTFQYSDGATTALNASEQDLKIYGKVMTVTAMTPRGERRPFVETPSDYVVECEDDVSPISQLTPALLTRILSELTLVERMLVERVSKTWMESSYASWRNLSTLVIDNQSLTVMNTVRPLNNHALKAVLQRSSPFVRFLDMSSTPHSLDEQALGMIAAQCTQLRHWNISGLCVSDAAVAQVSDSPSTLREIVCKNARNLDDMTLSRLLRACPSVTSIDVTGCHRLRGHFLSATPLTKVILNYCPRVHSSAIAELCVKSSNVQRLELDFCELLDDSSLGLITRTFSSTLSTLSLACSSESKTKDSFSRTALRQLGNLTDLTTLILNGQINVDDDVLACVIQGLPYLHTLGVASTSISHIPPCSLQNLDISSMDWVNDSSLNNLPNNLQTLTLKRCAIKGGGVAALLNSALSLRRINLFGSASLDTRVLLEALKSATHPCTIVVGGNNIDSALLSTKFTNGIRVIVGDGDDSHSTYCMDASVESDDESDCGEHSFVVSSLENDEYLPPDGTVGHTFDEHYAKVLRNSCLMEDDK